MTAATLHPLTEKILSGKAPAAVCEAAARGAVPVPPEELLRLRVHLARAGAGNAAELSRAALKEQPAEDLVPVLARPDCPAEVLDYVTRERAEDEQVLAAAVQNPATSDGAILDAVARAGGSALEQIVDNQVRLLRTPDLVKALDAHPGVTGISRSRLHDVKEELARRERRRTGAPVPAAGKPGAQAPGTPAGPAAEEPTPAPAAAPSDAEALQEGDAAGEPAEGAAAEAPPVDEDSDVFIRIMNMKVPEKVELAVKGNREERAILVRDPIKAVALAVLKSPKLTEPEVESIAAMRNVVEDVIRIISENREWTKNYAVIHALCKNPKTPARKAMTLMTRLNNRDLKLLGGDRSVSEIVRNNARRFYVARTQPKVNNYRKK